MDCLIWWWLSMNGEIIDIIGKLLGQPGAPLFVQI
jgi:hypothetical protein